MARANLPTIRAPKIPAQKNPSLPFTIAPIAAQITVAIQKADHPLFFSFVAKLLDDEVLDVVVRVVVVAFGAVTLEVDERGVET